MLIVIHPIVRVCVHGVCEQHGPFVVIENSSGLCGPLENDSVRTSQAFFFRWLLRRRGAGCSTCSVSLYFKEIIKSKMFTLMEGFEASCGGLEGLSFPSDSPAATPRKDNIEA